MGRGKRRGPEVFPIKKGCIITIEKRDKGWGCCAQTRQEGKWIDLTEQRAYKSKVRAADD